MKLKFDPNLQYQLDAIQSVIDVFDGQPPNKSDFEISLVSQIGQFSGLQQTELGIGNNLVLNEEELLQNVHEIQERNELEKTDKLLGWNIPAQNEEENGKFIPHFTVEMETGTGKTYIYLRTIFELNQLYGFKKFIIVVPSIAIREGVLKSIDITKDHFKSLYSGVSFDHFVYASKNINDLRQFATSNEIQIMVINIDAFRKTLEDVDVDKKSNVIYRENDRLSGRKPIEYVQATNPVVIIDEPQSVDSTPKSQTAIQMLNPMCTLRYSATHLQEYNLLYKLDPVKAFELKLVKQIAVASVLTEDNYNDAYIRLISTDNRSGIAAKLEVHVESNTGPQIKKITLKAGDDLFTRTSEREAYRHGYIVDEINTEPGNEFIRFSGGERLRLGESIGGLTDEIRKIQIRNTIREHLDKELQLKDNGIKVLSLIFIDRVANYRWYDEQGNPQKGKYAQWFEEEYKSFIARDEYQGLSRFNIEKIHDGYFAVDRKGREKDTRGESQADEDAYSKIMREKERLLSLNEPLKFIFSHSALREGWDNPNVFQICALNETGSELKKRQEIGRGLRLPVNQDGERIFDTSINKLVVIANEHYEDFAKTLQTEYEEECGIRFGYLSKLAFSKVHRIINGKDEVLGSRVSKDVWDELWLHEYIDEKGKILPKFNPDTEGFDLEIADKYQDIKHEIIDVVRGYQLSRHIVDHNQRKKLVINKRVYLDENFKKLWKKINKKTRFSVEYSTETLIKNCVTEMKKMDPIEKIKITVRKGTVDIDRSGVHTSEVRHQVSLAEAEFSLPDILAYLQRETELTRHTLFKILAESKRLKDFLVNPQKFMDRVVQIINRGLYKLMIAGIKYEKIGDEEYEMRLFEEKEIVDYLKNMVKVSRSVYDHIVYESEVERRFAEDLEQRREDIKLFVKLPDWFKIDTPLGTYNPDWAILKKNDEVLYLVRETKAIKDFDKLRTPEADKIQCGNKHFQELGVDFKIVVSASEV